MNLLSIPPPSSTILHVDLASESETLKATWTRIYYNILRPLACKSTATAECGLGGVMRCASLWEAWASMPRDQRKRCFASCRSRSNSPQNMQQNGTPNDYCGKVSGCVRAGDLAAGAAFQTELRSHAFCMRLRSYITKISINVNRCQQMSPEYRHCSKCALDAILEETLLKLTCKELAALEFSVALGGGWNCGEEDNSIMTSCILKTNLKATHQKFRHRACM